MDDVWLRGGRDIGFHHLPRHGSGGSSPDEHQTGEALDFWTKTANLQFHIFNSELYSSVASMFFGLFVEPNPNIFLVFIPPKLNRTKDRTKNKTNNKKNKKQETHQKQPNKIQTKKKKPEKKTRKKSENYQDVSSRGHRGAI